MMKYTYNTSGIEIEKQGQDFWTAYLSDTRLKFDMETSDETGYKTKDWTQTPNK